MTAPMNPDDDGPDPDARERVAADRPDGPDLEGLVLRARHELRDWTGRTGSDPGVALVELLAHVADVMSGYADRIAAESYLGTRDRRPSGVHRAVVVDGSDPLGQRRLLVRVPDVSGEASAWAAACVPVPGTEEVPAVGDAVWVTFEAGDPSRPVWLGRRLTD